MELFVASAESFGSRACIVAAQATGVKLTVKAQAEVTHPDFGAPFKLPALLTNEGFVFGEGAVLRHIARMHPAEGLQGENVASQAHVDQWIDFAFGDLNTCLVLHRGVPRLLDAVEACLVPTPFLSSFTLSLGDIAVLCRLAVDDFLLSEEVTKRVCLSRWVDACMHTRAVSHVLSDLAARWCALRGIPSPAETEKQRQAALPLCARVAPTFPVPPPAATTPAAKAPPAAGPPANLDMLGSEPPATRPFPEHAPSLRVFKGKVAVSWKGRDQPLASHVAAHMCNTAIAFTPAANPGLQATVGTDTTLYSDLAVVLFLLREQIQANREVWKWASLAQDIANSKDITTLCLALNNHLTFRTFVVGHALTAADVALFSSLNTGLQYNGLSRRFDFTNIDRYLTMLADLPQFVAARNALATRPPVDQGAQGAQGAQSAQVDADGFELDLPGAEVGKVVTRFPPEPSGYLHIGHVKAAMLNQMYAKRYNGQMILRFDDTNPAKEKQEFEVSIVEDLKRIGIVPDRVTHSSDHFAIIQQKAEELIKLGKGYMDKTSQEVMRQQRMDGIESDYRNQSVEENLRLWKEMLEGSEEGRTACLRAKMDMKADNKALRDPVCFRYSGVTHHLQPSYLCFPTYDFACPIVDSVEGVTHALRDRQFQDRNAQYQWFIDALNLRPVYVWGFSRLNLKRCLLSKRKIQWFVDTGRVEGWDDPRVPSIRGIVRRGLTVEALKRFVLSQGATKNLNLMSWDSLWTFNKKVLDPIVPRYTVLNSDGLVPVDVTNYAAKEGMPEFRLRDAHPKDTNVGKKCVVYAKSLWLEQVDAGSLSKGEKFTLMNWGNAVVQDIKKKGDVVSHVKVELKLDDTDYKKTKKFTWLAQESNSQVECELHVIDDLIVKDKLEDDDKIEDCANPNTRFVTKAVGDLNLRELQTGAMLQVERKGFHIVHRAAGTPGMPMQLIFIPDGHIAR